MHIRCANCQKKYVVEDDKIAELKQRNPICKQCGQPIFLKIEDPPTLIQPIDQRPPSAAPAYKPARSAKTSQPPLAVDNLPKKIGPYTIKGVLGRGAMGYVYKGYDESLRRHVAIKVLSPELGEQDEFRDRFNIEAQALATLVHPNITQIYSAGQEGDKMYFAMEYIEGYPADDLLHRKGKFTALEGLRIIKQICEGLKQASAKGIIHRDIKPGNILIGKDGAVKITDFGIAKIMKQDQRLTSTGMMIGTPAYTSPEQARGDKTDFRTDIYSLGATFYQLLMGKPPFEADSSMNVLMMHITEPIRFPMGSTGPVVPPQITGIIRKMMAKKPDDRFLSYDSLLLELSRVEAKLKEEEDIQDPEASSADVRVKTMTHSAAIIDVPTQRQSTPVTYSGFVAESGMPLQYKLLTAIVVGAGVYWGYQKWQDDRAIQTATESVVTAPSVSKEPVPEVVKRVKTIPPAPKKILPDNGDLSQVSILDSKIEQLEDDSYRVFGNLRNLGNDKVRAVVVGVTLKNIFDEAIARQEIEAEPQIILPGEQARFSVLFKNVYDVASHNADIVIPQEEHDTIEEIK